MTRPSSQAQARALGLDGSQSLIDIGAGPGLLALGFAPYCLRVVGVDPEPAMIAAARAAAARDDVALTLIEGRLEDLADDRGPFDLATIGRAIHWLDPQPARAALDRILARPGKVFVCRANSVKDGRNPWQSAFIALRRRFGGERPPHDERSLFAGSRFKQAGTVTVETSYEVPIERFADRMLSFSTLSPERLGESAAEEMRRAVIEALTPFATDGLVTDAVEARGTVFEG